MALFTKQEKSFKHLAIRSEGLVLWENLTPLGRNEFICWVDDAKPPKTRQRRIERTRDEPLEGKKRPCCWVALTRDAGADLNALSAPLPTREIPRRERDFGAQR